MNNTLAVVILMAVMTVAEGAFLCLLSREISRLHKEIEKCNSISKRQSNVIARFLNEMNKATRRATTLNVPDDFQLTKYKINVMEENDLPDFPNGL